MVIAWNKKEDDILLEAIQSGSHHAFSVLVERHSRKFYSLAYRYMAEKEAAEDIVQQAFLKLWEDPTRWKPEFNTRFTTWFYRVVVNLCLDSKRRKSPLPLVENFDIRDERETQEESLVYSQEARAVEQAINDLPDRQRTALNLCFYEELSNREAADILQVSIKALESLLMRAKKTLKEKLAEPDNDRQNKYG